MIYVPYMCSGEPFKSQIALYTVHSDPVLKLSTEDSCAHRSLAEWLICVQRGFFSCSIFSE